MVFRPFFENLGEVRLTVEFWTIYNVPDLDLATAREKSPTTHRFYSLINLSSPTTSEFSDFRDRLVSMVGIAAKPV
ncbi:MAG: XcyI family restriction endonuclease [Limisphaerales bacterium]